MDWFLVYNIKTAILSTIFYAVYHVSMRGDTHFAMHRYYLLITAFLSLLLPLIPLHFESNTAELLGNSVVLQTVTVTADGLNHVYGNNNSLHIWLWAIYLVPVLFLITRLVIGLWRIAKIFGNSVTETASGYKVIDIPADSSPFSFFGKIGLCSGMTSSDRQKILNHELVHVKHLHSIDILFFEILAAFQWFNPVMWLYRNAIREVHEFQADNEAILHNSEAESYRLLLFEMCSGKPVNNISNSFNNSLIKKRLIMMKTPKSGFLSALKPAIAIPLVAVAMFIFACANPQKQQNQTGQTDSTAGSPATNMQEIADSDSVFTMETVEKQPLFGEGEAELLNYISKNVTYPPAAKEKGIQGRVFVSFVIDETGNVIDVKVLQGEHELLNNEAIRVVSGMPTWKPGESKGKPVKVSYVLPINFKLN